MSERPDGEGKTFLQRFFELDRVPDERPPVIPKPYRIPFFVGLSIVALLALVLVVQLVVLPGIRAQQSGSATPPASSNK